MKLNNVDSRIVTVLLVATILLPAACAEPAMVNMTELPEQLNLTAETDTANLTVTNETVNATVIQTGYNNTGINETEPTFSAGYPNTGMATRTNEPNPKFSFTSLSTTAIPPDAKNYDHYVSFHMRADSLARNYAYDLINRGDRSGGEKWVYNFYMFGKGSSGYNGRIVVYGYNGMNNGMTQLSPLSTPLSPGSDYFVVWRYSDTGGGELIINDVSQGPAVTGVVDNSLSSAFHVGENMYSGGGRQHSAFNGQIWDVYHYEKDLEPEVFTYSITAVGNPGFPFEDVSDVAASCSNYVDQQLGENGLKWKRIFRNQESGVSKGDFGIYGGGLNEATFHYHVGHGSYELINPLNWGKTALVLSNGQWLYANDVKEKWGNKNKWIYLHSCNVLDDPTWGDALVTTHGIFGFKTEVKDCGVINQFLDYATEDDMSLYDSFYNATNHAYGSDTTAAVIFHNSQQAYGDHFPGHGTVQSDGSPDDRPFTMSWQCGRLI